MATDGYEGRVVRGVGGCGVEPGRMAPTFGALLDSRRAFRRRIRAENTPRLAFWTERGQNFRPDARRPPLGRAAGLTPSSAPRRASGARLAGPA